MKITQGGCQKNFGREYGGGGSILKMSKVWGVILLQGRNPEKFSTPPSLQLQINNDYSLNIYLTTKIIQTQIATNIS